MKTLYTLSFIVFIFISFQGHSQKKFPDITGKTLKSEEVTLPKQAEGKYTLIGIAYSKKAEEDLNTWYGPVYTTFIQEQEGGFLPVTSYDVNIYFVPMITGIAKAASGKIEDQMKKNINKELQPYIILYEGDIKEYKKQLNMTEKDEPYFFVLDEKGNIIYNCTGAFSEDKLDKITDLVDDF